jgi:hypothetical protein
MECELYEAIDVSMVTAPWRFKVSQFLEHVAKPNIYATTTIMDIIHCPLFLLKRGVT